MIDRLSLIGALPARALGNIIRRPQSAVADDAGTGVEPRPLSRLARGSHDGPSGARPCGPFELSCRFAPEPAAVPGAREALEPLATLVDRESFVALRLLVCELVTNGVRHGAQEGDGTIELSVRAAPHRVRAEVADSGAGFTPTARAEGSDQGSGWGLHLLEHLSDRWGVQRNGHTVVWFELEAESGADWWLGARNEAASAPSRPGGFSEDAERPNGFPRRLSYVRSLLAGRDAIDVDID
jgi:anti-sigma regulatory factor (Ser/Thr protein kinase)